MLRTLAAGLLAVAIALAMWSSLGGPALSGWGFGALLVAGILWLVDGLAGERQGPDALSIDDPATTADPGHSNAGSTIRGAGDGDGDTGRS